MNGAPTEDFAPIPVGGALMRPVLRVISEPYALMRPVLRVISEPYALMRPVLRAAREPYASACDG